MSENELSRIVFNCALKVHQTLGPGLLESAYEECLFYELRKIGLSIEKQKDDIMKRLIGILLCNLFILTACSASVDKTSNSTKTTDYKIENGETLKVPEKPKRVAVLTGFYVGDFIKLGIKPIAVSDITKDSSILKPYLKGVDYIGENDVERVAKAKPDLIVVDAMDKTIRVLEK